MRHITSPFLVAASFFLAAVPARAATRPHYGGNLRVEMRVRVASLDPREMPSDLAEAAASERLASLFFDRLVRLDEDGRPQAALAVSWQHDAESKRWRFRLRAGVKFHDGSSLTPTAAVAALGAVPHDWRASANNDVVVIESEQPMPDLLAELAHGRNFVFHAALDGSVVGTGAFRIVEWQPRSRLVLAANEDCWAGRPFLDSVAIELGVLPSQQLVDLELGKADVVELLPDQVRRASQSGEKIWSSESVELLALVFDRQQPAAQDPRVRQAVALSVDRIAIWSVLLQKQGEPAGGLLPQWLSGYAFLFSTAPDVERARQLAVGAARAGNSTVPPLVSDPLRMVYDSADPVARAVAERVAVNARAVGIPMRVSGQASGGGPSSAAASPDVRLVRLRLDSINPQAALESLAAALGQASVLLPGATSAPEQLYVAERALLVTYHAVPLVHLPESYGLDPRVKNWTPRRWGGWRLEEVWLDSSAGSRAGGDKP